MKTVQVTLASASYKILIGQGLLADAGDLVVELAAGLGGGVDGSVGGGVDGDGVNAGARIDGGVGIGNGIGNGAVAEKIMVVSDQNVWKLYGEVLGTSLLDAGLSFETVVLPAGENSKSLASLELLYSRFAQAGLSRSGLIVAFGGGVIGDLAGFAAATWMRGVSYVQIPTTLLAQVDSSVGGKTAVDLAVGKNLVGAFYQPSKVIADTDVLSTLPTKEFACGMAEVIKYGAIKSKDFFEQLHSPAGAPAVDKIVEICCTIKRDLVQQDEFDHGQRALLNFGHTFGHAVETLGGYNTYNHGQAVAIGMVLAAELGELLGVTPAGCADTLRQTLTEWKLPIKSTFTATEIMSQIIMDKKRQADSINMVLLNSIGQAGIVSLQLNKIEKLLKECLGE